MHTQWLRAQKEEQRKQDPMAMFVDHLVKTAHEQEEKGDDDVTGQMDTNAPMEINGQKLTTGQNDVIGQMDTNAPMEISGQKPTTGQKDFHGKNIMADQTDAAGQKLATGTAQDNNEGSLSFDSCELREEKFYPGICRVLAYVNVPMCPCLYMYVCMYVCMYVYIYIWG
jgi:hypothetical protein